jgi:hypothetical protein
LSPLEARAAQARWNVIAAATTSGSAAPAAAPTSSSSSTAAGAPRKPRPSAEEEMRQSTSFLLLRAGLMLVIFLLLFTLTQWYVLEPIFQPHRMESYKREQDAKMRAEIAAKICPPGQDCNYNLKPEYRV